MSQFESESANEIKYQLALRDQQIAALKIAATEQATHAKAVLEERTRERDDNRQVMEIQESALVKIKDLLSVEWCDGWGTLVERVAQIVKERDAALAQIEILQGVADHYRVGLSMYDECDCEHTRAAHCNLKRGDGVDVWACSECLCPNFFCKTPAGIPEAAEELKCTKAERDALALSQGRLLGALRARQQADDAWQDGRVPHNVCHNMTKRAQELARAAIAEATPEGEK